jgi:hypothetical protein
MGVREGPLPAALAAAVVLLLILHIKFICLSRRVLLA